MCPQPRTRATKAWNGCSEELQNTAISKYLLRPPQGFLGYQKEPELISQAVLCWERNSAQFIFIKHFRPGPRQSHKGLFQTQGNCSEWEWKGTVMTQGLYLTAHRTQSSLAPDPWAFGLPDDSAWGSSRNKQSTLPPNLPSLFNILYVGRQRPALPPPSTPHTELPPASAFLLLHCYLPLLDQPASSKLGSLPSSG